MINKLTKHLMKNSCILLILLSFISQADAAIVELNNGDRLSGTIISTENSAIHLDTIFGTVEIPMHQIASIRGSNETRTTTPAHTYTQHRTNDVIQEQIVSAPIAPAPTQGTEAIKTEDKTGLWGAKWKGNANFGASIQTGNSDKDALNADAALNARWEKHRASAKVKYNREDDEGTVSVDNKSLDLAYDYFFMDKWFWNNKLAFKQDDIEDLDLRTRYGMGIGHQLFEQDDLNLKYIIGLSYLHEKFENDGTDESLAYEWQFDYDQKLWGDFVKIFHNHDFILPSDDREAFLFDSSSGLRMPLKAGIIATAGIDFDWDNDPVAGTTEEDVIYSIKLGYEWGE